MDVAILKGKVLSRIDETAADMGGGVAARYNIEEFLDDALQTIALQAPTQYLPTAQLTATAVPYADGSGEVALPADFVRMVTFVMKGWEQPARLIQFGSEEYRRQYNRYVRGGVAKPIAVVESDKGGMKLHYFSLAPGADHTISKAVYVPRITAENLNSELVNPLCWLTASMIFSVTEQTEAATSCQQRYNEQIRQLHGLPAGGNAQ